MTDYQANAVLTSREDLSAELAIFRVRPQSGLIPFFLPGQYAELAIPNAERKIERRSYSIASTPANGELEFYIVLVEDGYLTNQLWALRPGDTLWLGPKVKGKFTLEQVPAGADLVMVATGTGLAPFVSMLRAHRTNPSWHRVTLIHGARYARDLAYRRELEEWEASHPWFRYLPTLTRDAENTSWSGARGRVQQLFTSGAVESSLVRPFSKESAHFLLCGNPQMIDGVQALLEARGFELHKKKHPGNIHVERYW